MPLPISIPDLISQRIVENARIEYKSDWNPERILHTICAFANDIDNWGGGYIVIGIDEEDGMPVKPIKGIEKASIDRINKEILQTCNLIEPRYIPIVEETSYEGKEIIVIWVPGGEDRPYKCPISLSGQKSAKAYYIRKVSSTIKANGQDEKELFSLASKQPYDDRLNLNAEIGDLKSSLISEFLYNVGSDLYEASLSQPVSETGTAMQIIRGPKEMRKPINAGLMFFNNRPDMFFPYAQIEVVDKPDSTGIGMTEKVFRGPLDKQLRDALSYINNYIIKEKITKISGQAEAERIFNYPYEAVEEALSNAVYHKSYQIGEPITVTVLPDRMEILSLPGPDRSISDSDIAACRFVSRHYRNRRIGDFLKELKLAEGRNTGIPLILKKMQQNGSDRPIFQTDEERSYFLVILPVNGDFTKTDGSSYEETEKKKRRSMKEIKDLIIEVLREENALSSTELSEKMGYSGRSSSLSKAIGELLSENEIEYSADISRHSRNQKLSLKK